MKRISWMAMAMTLAVLPVSAWAGSVDDTATVTVKVDNVLSISDAIGAFTLTFNGTTGTTNGSVSTGQTVEYTVKANNMSDSAIPGALSAKISGLLDGITFRANSGMNYVAATGSTTGDATLTPVSSSAVEVGTSETALFDKPASTGDQGKVLNGTAFINWGAVATKDLPESSNSLTLTVTLKDV